jgi:hypothetical protein
VLTYRKETRTGAQQDRAFGTPRQLELGKYAAAGSTVCLYTEVASTCPARMDCDPQNTSRTELLAQCVPGKQPQVMEGAVPSIGLAAGARRPACPWAAARAGAESLQGGAAKCPRARSTIYGSCSDPCRRAPGASTARGHIYLAQGTTVCSRGGVCVCLLLQDLL